METFQTQFSMQGVPTDITVSTEDNKNFGVVLNLVDFYEGEEIPAQGKDKDVMIHFTDAGKWEIVGDSKIDLSPEDVRSLGQTIERDYLYKL